MSAPLRLLFVIGRLEVGGAECALLEVVRRLDRRRHRIEVCALEGGGSLIPQFEELRVPVHSLGVGAGLAELRGLKLVPVVGRFRPDVVHGRLFLANLWARCARLFGARIVCSEESMADERPALATALNRATAPLCHLVLTNSRAVAARVQERDGFAPERIRTVYLGCDLDRFAPRARQARYDLIAVARLEKYKGVFDLVEMLQQVAARRPGVRMALVGDGSQRAAVEARRIERGLADHLDLLGQRSDVPELLRTARLFVSASHEEGFGMAALEAMASGLPVVGTRVGGFPEVVEDGACGALVAPRDPAALAAQALRYLESESLLRESGLAARSRAEKLFDVRRTVQEYEEVYRELTFSKSKR